MAATLLGVMMEYRFFLGVSKFDLFTSTYLRNHLCLISLNIMKASSFVPGNNGVILVTNNFISESEIVFSRSLGAVFFFFLIAAHIM